jgi:hypothetical protein
VSSIIEVPAAVVGVERFAIDSEEWIKMMVAKMVVQKII